MREEWKAAALESIKITFYDRWCYVWNHLQDETFGMLGPSFYVFQHAGKRFVIDPCFRFPWVRDIVAERMAEDLDTVESILITHSHSDHWELETVKMLSHLQVRWMIPDSFNEEMIINACLDRKKCIQLSDGDRIGLVGTEAVVFRSPHEKPDNTGGVPEKGFLFNFAGKHMLFPCDVRDYNTKKLPEFGQVNTVFAHLWLGNGNALNFPCEPYLSRFSEFVSHYKPDRVFLGHLYELGRTVDQMWTYTHAGLAADALHALNWDIEVIPLQIGKIYPL